MSNTGAPLNLPKPTSTSNTGQDMIQMAESLQAINNKIKDMDTYSGTLTRSIIDEEPGLNWREHLQAVVPRIQLGRPYQLSLRSAGGWRTATGTMQSSSFGSFLVYGYANNGAVSHAVLADGNWTYYDLTKTVL